MMRASTVFYLIFSILCCCGLLLPFGYAIAHGGESLLWLLSVCFAFFLLPLWLAKRLKEKIRFSRVLLLIPVLAIGGSLLYVLLLNPALERRQARHDLSLITIRLTSEDQTFIMNGAPLAITVSYTVSVPKDVRPLTVETSGSFFPNASIRSSAGNYDLYALSSSAIQRNGTKVNLYSEGLQQGNYQVTSTFSAQSTLMKKGELCRSFEPRLHDLTDPTERPLEMDFSSRAGLSLRMGYYIHDYPTLALKTKVSASALRQEIQSLPLCGQ